MFGGVVVLFNINNKILRLQRVRRDGNFFSISMVNGVIHSSVMHVKWFYWAVVERCLVKKGVLPLNLLFLDYLGVKVD